MWGLAGGGERSVSCMKNGIRRRLWGRQRWEGRRHVQGTERLLRERPDYAAQVDHCKELGFYCLCTGKPLGNFKWQGTLNNSMKKKQKQKPVHLLQSSEVAGEDKASQWTIWKGKTYPGEGTDDGLEGRGVWWLHCIFGGRFAQGHGQDWSWDYSQASCSLKPMLIVDRWGLKDFLERKVPGINCADTGCFLFGPDKPDRKVLSNLESRFLSVHLHLIC